MIRTWGQQPMVTEPPQSTVDKRVYTLLNTLD